MKKEWDAITVENLLCFPSDIRLENEEGRSNEEGTSRMKKADQTQGSQRAVRTLGHRVTRPWGPFGSSVEGFR